MMKNKKKQKYYYKLVGVGLDGKYYSFGKIISEVQYKVGEWSYPRPRSGPLCVFSNLKDLENFVERTMYIKVSDYLARDNEVAAVFVCEVKRSRNKKVWDPVGKEAELRYLPEGTILADKVKILHKIYLEGALWKNQ